jgi:hypothetical protein
MHVPPFQQPILARGLSICKAQLLHTRPSALPVLRPHGAALDVQLRRNKRRCRSGKSSRQINRRLFPGLRATHQVTPTIATIDSHAGWKRNSKSRERHKATDNDQSEIHAISSANTYNTFRPLSRC